MQIIGHGCSSRPKSRSGRSSVALTRAFISPAALLVNVIARIDGAGIPWAIRYATRRVITRVLPLPAAATIKSGPSTCVAASRCGAVRSFNNSSVFSNARSCHRPCGSGIPGPVAPAGRI